MNATQQKPRIRVLAILLWAVFLGGLTVQAFAPRLKIERGSFVMPKSLIDDGKGISPAEIVARERKMQILSAVLMTGGALGLAMYYRNAFVRRRSG